MEAAYSEHQFHDPVEQGGNFLQELQVHGVSIREPPDRYVPIPRPGRLGQATPADPGDHGEHAHSIRYDPEWKRDPRKQERKTGNAWEGKRNPKSLGRPTGGR